ncbi:MAG: toxin-antitoxin system HicB family antitoxin [Crocosphaera sp.]|nr:toxin-antitoxin system HicB family antitoxin [Crocosphaera sp.]
MINYEHYTYQVTWSEEDQEFVGLCLEYPSLSYLDTSHSAALTGIINLVKDIVTDMETNGEEIPEPSLSKSYNGKLQLSITPKLYQKLATEAAAAKVSLEYYISQKLT